jgi:hypothetical protein
VLMGLWPSRNNVVEGVVVSEVQSDFAQLGIAVLGGCCTAVVRGAALD